MQPMTTARTGGDRGDRRPSGLSRCAREIVVVLVVKTFVLVAIWQLWFSAPSRPQVDSEEIAARIYSTTAVPANEKERHARP
jgi:hypothetical protein